MSIVDKFTTALVPDVNRLRRQNQELRSALARWESAMADERQARQRAEARAANAQRVFFATYENLRRLTLDFSRVLRRVDDPELRRAVEAFNRLTEHIRKVPL